MSELGIENGDKPHPTCVTATVVICLDYDFKQQ
jgi:hypothetical protein